MRQRELDQKLSQTGLVRAGVLALFVLCWWLLAMRNASLRVEERTEAERAQISREVGLLRVAVLEAQALLPEPGTGEAAWWKTRIEREAERNALTVVSHEAGATELTLGPFMLQRRELVVTGVYSGLVRLVAWIATSTPRMRLESFQVEASSPGVVRASLSLTVPSPGKTK